MVGMLSRAADWAVRHRSSLPQWMNRAMESAARQPDGVIGRISARLLGGGGTGAVTAVPDRPLKVYIAPTNYAGQGFRWARSLEREDPRIGARSVAVTLPGGYDFATDTPVSIAVVNGSTAWADAEWDAARRFTHVLIEAERSMFGRRFGRDLEAEILALEAEGVSVAYLCHGTDIRDPDRNAARTPWSLYPEDPRTDVLRQDAATNLALLTRLKRPTFVSTPDLVVDVPWASWCPVVIDPERWRNTSLPFDGERVRIVHASSAPLQKGTHLLEPALAELTSTGPVELRIVTSTPSSEMPALFADADIVLDQFRVGSYGVAACEAMAAGRVVIGHVLPDVRELIEQTQGIALPIVEATPDTLVDTIRSLQADPQSARKIAAAGPEFVARAHSGRQSARVLIDEWIDRSN